MPDIQILSPHLADLIAAGEVVERPASVVKELVENAFDAGARTVTVELRGGGATYLRVTDDGCGMAPEDAGIAFLRHATSKLHDEQGLEAIGTMGFRGEALAAISAVSHITLTTRQRGAASGTHMTLDAGDIQDMYETGCPEGTTMIVRDLFFNTPARRKFLKSDRAEGAACAAAALRCALGRPDVSVRCIRDGEDAVRRISSYRIKYIRYYDTDDTLLKETAYKYGPGEDGCGIIRHEPDMDADMGTCHTEQTVSYYYPRDSWSGSYSLGATLRLRTYYPHTIYRTNYDDGSHVQYDEVAEYQSAGGTLSGKTVYKYDLTNRHARPVREVFAYPNAPYPVEGDTWYLGQLDSVVQYKYDGGRFDWVARRAYTYNRYDASERIFCARVWASAVGYLLGGSQQIDDGHTFEYSYNGITPGCMQLAEEVIEQREDDGRILRRRTNYYYDTNPYTASRKETTYADGRTVTERTLYAEDYLPSSVQTMLDRNLLSLPLERVVYTDETVTHGDTFHYDLYGRPDSLSTLASLDLSPASFRFSNRSSTGGKGAYTPDTHYIGRASLRYDADGNICEVQAVGQPPICYLWGYKGQYRVAEIRNAAYDEVTTALGAATVERIRTSVVLSEGDLAALDGLRTSRKEWHVTTATYIPLVGMASMTDPSGRETTYEYNAHNHLMRVRDHKGKVVNEYEYSFDQ